uniref:Uncharacterized protein n=1 Tax=Hyaloperonospora arabidopsidis (strain Emoy2) TaxID=559515 RepID=M4B4A8_HYAAE
MRMTMKRMTRTLFVMKENPKRIRMMSKVTIRLQEMLSAKEKKKWPRRCPRVSKTCFSSTRTTSSTRITKIDRKTGRLVLGVVADLEPPSQGKYSRWRIDYRDGSSELLTRIKAQAAINRAAVEKNDGGQDDDGSEGDLALIVRGKRKRNDVDYRQLNNLMFAGNDEDSEDDENYEAKEGCGGESDEDENNDDEEKSYNERKGDQESVQGVLDQKWTTTVAISHDKVSKPLSVNRSHRKRGVVDYRSMHEGLYS